MDDSPRGSLSPGAYHRGGPHGPREPERPARRHRLLLALLRRLPQAALSRATGRVADLPVPGPLRSPVYGFLSRRLGIDPEEAEKPLAEYRSVNAFFVRRLRQGARPWPAEPEAAGSPVDGIVGPAGRVREGTLLQAKGRPYGLGQLLGSEEEARVLEGGFYLTLYLAPHHYHRIHAPVTARVRAARHLPGSLLPVTPWARSGLPDLFPRNERLVAFMDASSGGMALAAVGAFNVGRISAAFDPSWNGGRGGAEAVTNRRARREPGLRRYAPPVEVARGDELMAFHLGSTVILLWEGRAGEPARDLSPGDEIRLGEPILEERRRPA